MNFKNWNGKKKAFAILIALALIIGLIVTIYIVQTRLDTVTRAEKATVLSFNPPNQTINAEESLSLDINVDPGVNQVNFVKMVINFDSSKFDSGNVTFTRENNSSFQLVSDPVVSDGQIIVTLNTGGNPTDIVRIPQKIGTLLLVPDSSKEKSELAGITQVTFDEAQSEVRSIASTDAFNENVLSSTIPATVTIEAICRPDISTCSWDPVVGAVSYHYVITNVDDGEIIDEGDTPLTTVEFTTEFNVTYTCNVAASNDCGNSGEAGEGEGICVPPPEPTPTATPSPSLSPSPTPTLPPGVSPTPTPSITLTPTPTVTLTPTPTPTEALTPTPTLAISSTPTPSPSPTLTPTPEPTLPPGVSATPTPTPVLIAQASPTPSIPPTGSTVVAVGGIIGAALIILGGLVLFAL